MILIAYSQGNLTKLAEEYFWDEDVELMMNQNSGNVFLTNSGYQVLMLCSGQMLDLFIVLSYSGEEGFLEDLLQNDPNYYSEEDKEQLLDYLRNSDLDLEEISEEWQDLYNNFFEENE
jgi:hypothetical protein